jgi:hypothetical protein
MRRGFVRHGLLIAACVAGLVAPVALTRGEVAKTGEPQPKPRPERLTPGPGPEVTLRAQCWQEGVKIIDQDGLQGVSLRALTEQQSVSFKRRAEGHPSVFLLPFADALCLVQPAQ